MMRTFDKGVEGAKEVLKKAEARACHGIAHTSEQLKEINQAREIIKNSTKKAVDLFARCNP